jgi:hypothetical protein
LTKALPRETLCGSAVRDSNLLRLAELPPLRALVLGASFVVSCSGDEEPGSSSDGGHAGSARDAAPESGRAARADASAPDTSLDPTDARPDADGDADGSSRAMRVDVLTQRNDARRSGVNLAETVLDTSNVSAASFGRLYSRPVDDQTYAQPLVVTGVSVPGKGTRNVVYVATVNDSVYAFDADDPSVVDPLWQVSLLPAGSRPPLNTDMTGACGGHYMDFSGHIGIVSTPVIDRDAGTLFVLARTVERGAQVQRLHALSIADGTERPHSPVVVRATASGGGAAADGGVVAFDPLHSNQRAGLLLMNGTVYLSWAGHCDWQPYHGWILGYDAGTLEQKTAYTPTPGGSAGGIWQSGEGLATDGVFVYAVTGNGTVGEPGDPRSLVNRGQSFLKLRPEGGTLSVESWFTPYDYRRLESADLDLGSAGLLLIPDTHLAVSGGKGGKLYVVDSERMGGLSSSGTKDDNVVQSFDVNAPDHIHGSPLFWRGPGIARLFVWGEKDTLKSYPFLGAAYAPGSNVFDVAHVETSTVSAPNDLANPEMPGGVLSLSANGEKSGSAILWASVPFDGDANQRVRPGILRAFDAADVTHELWNSHQNATRDDCGNYPKFAAATIANGRVYYGSFSNQLCVYGLLGPPKQ